ncbi:hypothetical protein RFI_05967 [Reticulomyxa filosa]|uniref:Uncharacterized protein n=1 Tax=Reticulomyxa filosa TaxID=46433 RepID=X6NYU0_RETFI|nr:hypothetical protein RFI_05967 [Reticulomyxa filosa]|eukprot:ETO31151.1 hypothetical protein RFI_05967 [Reticulomyxa filosa]
MIGYNSEKKTIVLMGGQLDGKVSSKRVISAKRGVVSEWAGSPANTSQYVMFDEMSVSMNEAIYYLSIVNQSRGLQWEVFNVSTRAKENTSIKDMGSTRVISATLCAEEEEEGGGGGGGARIFVNILGEQEGVSSYYSRSMGYVTTNNTWYDISKNYTEAWFGSYSSCVWIASKEQVWTFGGMNPYTNEPLSAIWSIDHSTGIASLQGHLVIPRMSATTFALRDSLTEQRILVVGGCLQWGAASCNVSITNSEIYDPMALSLSGFGPYLTKPLAQLAGTFQANVLWLFGGASSGDNANARSMHYLNFTAVQWAQLIHNCTHIDTIYVSSSSSSSSFVNILLLLLHIPLKVLTTQLKKPFGYPTPRPSFFDQLVNTIRLAILLVYTS